jgi:4'-phosphopantetheinyl transferase
MRRDSQGRPLIGDGYDFNISHSGSGAVCAITTRGRVGIDLELLRVVDPQHFALCMSAAQLEAVKHHENPSRALLTLWVEKESVVKADGCAFNADLRTLQRQGQCYSLGAEIYTVAGVALHPDYLCCVAQCGASELVVEPVVWDGDLLLHQAEVL